MLKLQGHRGKVRALAFSADGKQLASVAARERSASLWELPTGTRTLVPLDGEVQALTFSPDGALILASDRYLYRWVPATKLLSPRWQRGANYCWQVAVSPDSMLLAASCYNRHGNGDCYRVDLFRPSEPDAKKKFLVGGYGWPKCLAFSPNGRYLAAGGSDKKVRVWSMKEKAKAVSWTCAGTVLALAFSADENLIAVSAGKKLTLYDVATRKPCGELPGHSDYVGAIAVGPDGTLLSASDDGTARLWDVSTQREKLCFDWKLGKLNAAAFSPDGTLAAVGGEDGIVVWDVE